MTNIKIYSTPSCIYCKYAKSFFEKKNIAIQEIDVSEDREAQNYIMTKTGQMGVPVIEIGNDIVVGFDQVMLEKILAKYSN